jgi:hypothetical protein
VFKDSAAAGGSPVAWMTPFLVAGSACLLGAVVMLFTRAPQPQALRTGGKGGAGRPSGRGDLRPLGV